MNSGTNGGGNGAYGGGNTGQNGQAPQNSLQQQLVQQLSQQLSQQMSQKFPQGNILSALANVQAQMQNPQQQQGMASGGNMQNAQQQQQQQQGAPDFMAMARSGNLANVAGLMSPTNGAKSDGSGDAQANQPADVSSSASGGGKKGGLNDLAKAAQKPSAAPPSLGHVGEVRAGFQGQPSAASAGGGTDTAKDERRKVPGSVIVPCRARGMPMDHNFKTAYFVIPENVRHGEELICSYFACRNAGVKFRYCSHCKVPVAKRNFRKRHKHGDNSGKDAGEDEEQSMTEEDGASDEGDSADHGAVPSQVMANRNNMKDSAIPSQVTTADDGGNKNRTEDGFPSQVTTRGNRKVKPQSKKASGGKYSNMSQDSRSVCMRSGDERSKVVESRRTHWARLLDKRPQTKDGEAMSLWLMQVLAVSDLWKPLNESDAMPTTSLDLIRECARADTQAGVEPAKKPAASQENAAKDDSGSSDSQETKDDSEENQGANDAENESNNESEADNNGNEADGDGEGDGEGEEEEKAAEEEKEKEKPKPKEEEKPKAKEEEKPKAKEEEKEKAKEPEPVKKKSVLLKKRPVSDLKTTEDDEKSSPPASKPKL